MPRPHPGVPVRGSTTGRPIMALLDLLGRRWILRVVWELGIGPLGFRDLQERCDAMSSSVLSQRLGELRDAGIAVQAEEGGPWSLTPHGGALLRDLAPLDAWAREWAGREGGTAIGGAGDERPDATGRAVP